MALFPDSTNTGTTGTLIPSGPLVITTDGATVENLDIDGYLVIDADNVTVTNCKVTADSFVGIQVLGQNAVIENCEIVSADPNGGTKGVWFDGGAGGVVRACDIHNVEDGVYITTTNILVEDNYIHNLSSTGVDPHYDGIQLHGGVASDVTIRHNSVLVADSANSAITMGTVQDVMVDGNWLDGGGYTIHVDGRFGGGEMGSVTVSNNRFTGGTFGDWTVEEASPVFKSNVDHLSGLVIPSSAGNDVLRGKQGLLDGGAGNDTVDYSLVTGNVVLTLNGATAATARVGGVNTDTIKNVENITGGLRRDTLTGDSFVNILQGKADNDILNGKAGADTLIGGGGNDTLNGGTNNDTLTSNSGVDTFVFNSGGGADKVTDFTNGVDKIKIAGVAGVDDFSDLVLIDTGPGVLVNYGSGTVLLANVSNFANIDASDFIFA